MSHQVMTPQQARDHKALLWRNIRHHERQHQSACLEQAQTLRLIFAPLLALKLPRIPKPKQKQ